MLVLRKDSDMKYNPNLHPERILLSKDITLLGRSSELVDIVMDSCLCPLMISRVHAKISRENNRFCIECNSLNGILVNFTKRKKWDLKHGDVVVFGGAGTRTSEGAVVSKPSSELVYVFTNNDSNGNDAQCNNMAVDSVVVNVADSPGQHLKCSKEIRFIRDENKAESAEGTSGLNNMSNSKLDDKFEKFTENTSKVTKTYQNEENSRENKQDSKIRFQDSRSQSTGTLSQAEGSRFNRPLRNNTHEKIVELNAVHTDLEERFSSEEEIVFKVKKKRSRMLLDSDEDSCSPIKKFLKKDSSKESEEEVANLDNQHETGDKLFLKDLNQELLCCICQELLVLTHALACSHTFCYVCIRSWLRESVDCPSCRSKASFNTLVPVKVLDNMVDKVAARILNSEELKERNIKIQELQGRINGRMEEQDELRVEYGSVGDEKEYCEKCNLAISNRLIRWVISFPKTSSIASYHFKCFKPPSWIHKNEITFARGISKKDMAKINTVVKT